MMESCLQETSCIPRAISRLQTCIISRLVVLTPLKNMFVQFQSFPQVGRGENSKKTCETTIQTPKKTHPKTTCSEVVVSNASNRKTHPKLPNSHATTFSSTSPIRVPWSHLRCPWQRFRHSSKPVVLPKRTGIPNPLFFQLQEHPKTRKHTSF